MRYVCLFVSLQYVLYSSFAIAMLNVKWVRSQNCGCLVTWFCYQLIAKPGNKAAAVPCPGPYHFSRQYCTTIYLAQLIHHLLPYSHIGGHNCLHWCHHSYNMQCQHKDIQKTRLSAVESFYIMVHYNMILHTVGNKVKQSTIPLRHTK